MIMKKIVIANINNLLKFVTQLIICMLGGDWNEKKQRNKKRFNRSMY